MAVSVAEALPAATSRPTKLFIGGIKRHTTTRQLRDHFAKYGRVLDCIAMREADGRPRGFGYVTLDSPATAELCLREPQVIDDRVVDMKLAVPEKPAHAAIAPKEPETISQESHTSNGPSPGLPPHPPAWPNAYCSAAAPWWAGGTLPPTFGFDLPDVLDVYSGDDFGARAAFRAHCASAAVSLPGALSACAPEFLPPQQQPQQFEADPFAPRKLEVNGLTRPCAHHAENARAEPRRIELQGRSQGVALAPALGLQDITNKWSNRANVCEHGNPEDVKKLPFPMVVDRSMSHCAASWAASRAYASYGAFAVNPSDGRVARSSNDENTPPGLSLPHCATGLSMGFDVMADAATPSSPASEASTTFSGACDDSSTKSHAMLPDCTGEALPSPSVDSMDAGRGFPRRLKAASISEVLFADVRVSEEAFSGLSEVRRAPAGAPETTADDSRSEGSDVGTSGSAPDTRCPLPSKGSALHSLGECRRCNFFAKGRCSNGENCDFCHMPHERRKASRQEKRERRAAWLVQQAEKGLGQQEQEQGINEALSGDAASAPPPPQATPVLPGPEGQRLEHPAGSWPQRQAVVASDPGACFWEDGDCDGAPCLRLPTPLLSLTSFGSLLPPGLPPPRAVAKTASSYLARPADWFLATPSGPSTIQCSFQTPLASTPFLSLSALTPMASPGLATSNVRQTTRNATTQTDDWPGARCGHCAGLESCAGSVRSRGRANRRGLVVGLLAGETSLCGLGGTTTGSAASCCVSATPYA